MRCLTRDRRTCGSNNRFPWMISYTCRLHESNDHEDDVCKWKEYREFRVVSIVIRIKLVGQDIQLCFIGGSSPSLTQLVFRLLLT